MKLEYSQGIPLAEEISIRDEKLEHYAEAIVRSNEEIDKLKEQIEDMKCCGNCEGRECTPWCNNEPKCKNWKQRDI